ncbi:hypothetical protein BP5796_03714 [Coleophoma crateriformis]|uniref:Apple domain-containing protein n=1 Tax=Coleophoma crateriformis TaxID=565419 RepID=A0A3D8SGA8_9HELO|nr:hypothetical protein BP5796_03714 [Coleophoma crateriformis]
MRCFLVAAAVMAAVSASPKPQDMEIDMIIAAPDPVITGAPVGVAEQLVTYDVASASAMVVAAVLDDAEAADAEADATDAAITDATVTDAARMVKRTACAPQPAGATGAPAVSSDTPSAFSANPAFAAIANAAPVPLGYALSFQNLKASNNAYAYLGFNTLSAYNTTLCAAKCSAKTGCLSFNLYFERDPSVTPGPGCEDPPSYTMIKCVYWGGPVTTANALNQGQFRSKFHVVIAGSNGYNYNGLPNVPGYITQSIGNASINAPYDSQGCDTYITSTIIEGAPFDPANCAAACYRQSIYNLDHPPKDGPPKTCQFFNTYLVYVNTTANMQGQYCALYSEAWPTSYATNFGQYRGNDHYLIESSYTYTNETNPGVPDQACAVAEAAAQISYSKLQLFCMAYLGLAVPTATATTTVVATVTSISTSTVHIDDSPQKRAVDVPNDLQKYPSSVLSSACSLKVPFTVTTTATSSTTTTVATTTTTSTTTYAETTP